jgi:glycine cleavage system H lipoate-binding protein
VLPKNLGSLVEPGRSIMGVGLAKSIVSVTSPVCGVVLEDKPLLE